MTFMSFLPTSSRGNTVLIMTLSPAAGVFGPTVFQPGGLYELKIDNTGDAVEDVTYTLAFSEPNAHGVQGFMLVETRNGKLTLLAQGMTGHNVQIRGGGLVRADIFDDPFFFDSLHTNEFFRRVDNNLPNPVGPFLPVDPGTTDRPATNPNIPNDFFAGLNTLAIVLDLPTSRLVQSRTNPKFGVWARTILNGEQVDRMGIPAVNTAVIPRLQVVPGVVLKDAFNAISPVQDRYYFRQIVINEITRVFRFGNPAGVPSLVDLLLPDILPYNTTAAAGFPNGRQLSDDVIDTELDLLTNGALDERSRAERLGVPGPVPLPRNRQPATAAQN